MATVVRLPKPPESGLGQIAGAIIGNSIAESRRKKRSQAMLDAMDQMFPDLDMDEETKSQLVESGMISDEEDLFNFLSERRSQAQARRQEELHPLRKRQAEEQIESSNLQQRRGRAQEKRAQSQEQRAQEAHELEQRQAGEVEMTITQPDTGRTRKFVGSRDIARGKEPLPQRLRDQGWVAGEAPTEDTGGETLFRDKPELEVGGFGSERDVAESQGQLLTLKQHKAKYPEAHKGSGDMSDSDKEKRALIKARGLPVNDKTLNAARIEIDEWNDIKTQISETFADRFGESFSFDSPQNRRLNEYALERANDLLWQAAQSEDAEVPSPGDIGTQAVQQAINFLGPPGDQPAPSEQLESIREEDRQAASQPSTGEESGFVGKAKEAFGFGSGEKGETTAPADAFASARQKVDAMEDDSLNQLADFLVAGRYTDAIRMLESEGLSRNEARDYIIKKAEEVSPYGGT